MRYFLFLLILPVFFSCKKDPVIPESDYFPLVAEKEYTYQRQLIQTFDSSIISDEPVIWKTTRDTVIAGKTYNGRTIPEENGSWDLFFLRKEGTVHFYRKPWDDTEYPMLDASRPVGYTWQCTNTTFEIAGKYESKTYEGKTFYDVIEVKEYAADQPENFALTGYANYKGMVYEYRPYPLGLYYTHSRSVLVE